SVRRGPRVHRVPSETPHNELGGVDRTDEAVRLRTHQFTVPVGHSVEVDGLLCRLHDCLGDRESSEAHDLLDLLLHPDDLDARNLREFDSVLHELGKRLAVSDSHELPLVAHLLQLSTHLETELESA